MVDDVACNMMTDSVLDTLLSDMCIYSVVMKYPVQYRYMYRGTRTGTVRYQDRSCSLFLPSIRYVRYVRSM